jgi:hypothetical protein
VQAAYLSQWMAVEWSDRSHWSVGVEWSDLSVWWIGLVNCLANRSKRGERGASSDDYQSGKGKAFGHGSSGTLKPTAQSWFHSKNKTAATAPFEAFGRTALRLVPGLRAWREVRRANIGRMKQKECHPRDA